MNTVRMGSLGVKFEVPDNYSYTYHGEVSSMSLKGARISLSHGLSLLREHKDWEVFTYPIGLLLPKFIRNKTGICQTYVYMTDSVLDVSVHTYVQKGLIPLLYHFVKGHEETHALDFLGRIDVLEILLELHGIEPSGLRGLDLESRADIGGMYALMRNTTNEGGLISGADDSMTNAYEWIRERTHKTLPFTMS